ncbi:hypothetical protein MPTK1_4g12040 [Marchantia polymorpha subsp. ruderalis]|uniref:DUF7705 domain-containing protein n=2 Tax=Marchantia polymorpha TaxID=3197 RepID=A0AAF6B909_MARPO|nr:hypothetical protein MARPO_0011s0186 [Marchantia polymorpha]BBN08493.1 hypothetical protein Mp_4g12040 [Marchantia polymorpha subsp. ruderalis]|eukprot:PTQ46527.1 hypothetical protein MARPO_0011s0186 [Marchantia polymorpha]
MKTSAADVQDGDEIRARRISDDASLGATSVETSLTAGIQPERMALHVTAAPWGVILLFLLALLSFSSRVEWPPIAPTEGQDPSSSSLNALSGSGLRSADDQDAQRGESAFDFGRLWRSSGSSEPELRSALGDPGMRSDKVRVAAEAWNFCNRVGMQTDSALSPRWADCADLSPSLSTSGELAVDDPALREVLYKVSDFDNELKTGDSFPQHEGEEFRSVDDPDLYAVEKEKYLASLCAVNQPVPWHFWMIMLKNGNFDLKSNLCPIAGSSASNYSVSDARAQSYVKSQPVRQLLEKEGGFPCFGPGCMNQPLLYHNWSQLEIRGAMDSGDTTKSRSSLTGSFYGTYDLDSEDSMDSSYFSVRWYKNESPGSWTFHHVLRVSDKYPWLMLYLRADATRGGSGGYPWDTRGMMHTVPKSPDFKVVVSLDVIRGGGSKSQFYLLDIGGCWKNDGNPCNGDLATDVTRYSEMIINPDIDSWCAPDSIDLCPPYHTTAEGEKIHRNDTAKFPYDAYHLYCAPYNAQHAEKPFRVCDRYSNPQAQELQQLLPHAEWAVHGYPAKKGDGWVGDARKWELDAGVLSSRLYFYQDPGTPAAVRMWPSVDVGTEVYVSTTSETAEWTVSDFDVLVPK